MSDIDIFHSPSNNREKITMASWKQQYTDNM